MTIESVKKILFGNERTRVRVIKVAKQREKELKNFASKEKKLPEYKSREKEKRNVSLLFRWLSQ